MALPLSLPRPRFVAPLALDEHPQPPVVPVRLPVVLLHGFGTMATIGRPGMLHALAMHLRRHGVRAFAPNAPPYAPIAARGAAWAERLDRVLDETGAERLHLIGFSAGGLDARRLPHHGYADRIASITTVATPHHGTPLADWLLGCGPAVRSPLLGLMKALGQVVYPEQRPEVEVAIAELSPEAVCEGFNPAHPDVPGIRYESWSSRAGHGTDVPLHPLLTVHNRILYAEAGVNDGFVPEASARWGTHRGTLDADHGRLIKPQSGRPFDAPAFFLDRARELAARGE